MTIELVNGRDWWVSVNGTRVMRLADLSPNALPIEVRRVAEQELLKLVEAAVVCR